MRYCLLAVLAILLAWSPGSGHQGKNPVVVMETTLGTIKIELFADKAPITVKNFLDYSDAKFYDGTVFHRVIPNFMIQGGGLTEDMKEKQTKAAIKNEAGNGLQNERGTIAMARTKAPDSATSQFFINVKHNKQLDRANTADQVGYAVFGRVTEGMEVVDKIISVPTGSKSGHKDVPLQNVIIKSVQVQK